MATMIIRYAIGSCRLENEGEDNPIIQLVLSLARQGWSMPSARHAGCAEEFIGLTDSTSHIRNGR